MKLPSLRQRLIVLVMISLLVVWSVMALFSYRESREEINELFDAQLAQAAHIILLLDLKRLQRLVDDESKSQIITEQDDDELHAGALSFQVWDATGRLLLHNASAPHIAFHDDSGLDTITGEGKTWRTMALWNRQHGFQVRVFEDMQQRGHLAAGIVRRMSLPLLLALPGLAFLIWLSIGRGLQPLALLSAMIGARTADKLEPISEQNLPDVPQEVAPLLASLNGLLQRLSHSMDQERRFTADAAHELRTPLAAIQVQAEVALAEQDRRRQDQALRGIIEGVKQTTRLSEQLLMLARMDHLSPELQEPVDLCELARQTAAGFANRALEKEIELSVRGTQACRVHGDSVLLATLLGNLLENAIRYTQPHGNIEIAVEAVGEHVLLSVKDDGPGLSEQDKRNVLRRFYRGVDSHGSGSGLGLSIVERIAMAHRAVVSLDMGLGGKGMGVFLQFPKNNSSGRSRKARGDQAVFDTPR